MVLVPIQSPQIKEKNKKVFASSFTISKGGNIHGINKFQALARQNISQRERPLVRLSSRLIQPGKQIFQDVMIEKAMAETFFVRRNPGSKLIIEHRDPD